MSLSLSETFKGTANQILIAMSGYLSKAAAHAEEKGIDESVFLNARHYPDMFPMIKQVQIATDFTTRGAARLSGQELPSFPDTETSFAELIARIEKAIEFVNASSDEAINASEETVFQLPAGKDVTMPLTGKAYVTTYIIPNLIFHSSTAYGILRSQGVVLGKRDFLMPAGFKL